MNVRQKLIMSLTSLLTLAAAVTGLLFATPYKTEADTLCYYAGQAYSVGATVQAACGAGQSQQCLDTGRWAPCAPPG